MLFYYNLFIMNMISFWMCYNDKKRAIKHKRRISEKTLLLISSCGGAFGFMIAMYQFHHKTKHIKFLILEPIFIILWLIIIFVERGILW